MMTNETLFCASYPNHPREALHYTIGEPNLHVTSTAERQPRRALCNLQKHTTPFQWYLTTMIKEIAAHWGGILPLRGFYCYETEKNAFMLRRGELIRTSGLDTWRPSLTSDYGARMAARILERQVAV